MSNYIVNVDAGEHFDHVTNKIKGYFQEVPYGIYEFEFNGVKCLMDKDTNSEWLYRDYSNAHLMGWEIIGPKCTESYSPEIEKELQSRIQQKEEDRRRAEEEYENKCNLERQLFNEKINGVIIEFKDELMWREGKDKNTDAYGACIYEYAEGWAKLMQSEMSKGIPLNECAGPTSYELGFLGITGFMYDAAVSVLSHCWKHGEELRKWHNKEYNHEGEGVVNPAIITIG